MDRPVTPRQRRVVPQVCDATFGSSQSRFSGVKLPAFDREQSRTGLSVYRMVLCCCAFVMPHAYTIEDLFSHFAKALVHMEKEVRDTAWHTVMLRIMTHQPDLRPALLHSMCDLLLSIEDNDLQLQVNPLCRRVRMVRGRPRTTPHALWGRLHAPPPPGSVRHGTRVHWCPAGEWSFVRNQRHSISCPLSYPIPPLLFPPPWSCRWPCPRCAGTLAPCRSSTAWRVSPPDDDITIPSFHPWHAGVSLSQ